MNSTTCSTRACTLDELNPSLKTAMHAHTQHYGMDDSESNILMCCETKSLMQKNGLFGGQETSLSAAYVTPKWLVWAVLSNGNTVSAGSALLSQIEARSYETTAMYAIMPNHGLNITGRYTGGNRTGMTFISLGTEPDGQNFQQVLKKALNKTAK
ncbi:MAG: hypothetical protein ABI904_22815 [Chloroflexota bacterium]